MDNRPIGVFDSGLGGLTAMRELIRTLPNESILYFGDTGRVPYGSRARDHPQIRKTRYEFSHPTRRKSRVGRLWYGQLCCP